VDGAAHRDGAKEGERHAPSKANVPDKVARTLRYIDEHHRAPSGYEGGRTFHNAGQSGEKGLPRTDSGGRPITYREWDVNPKVPGVNRGAERLVTGSDGSAYSTSDHYRTFSKVR
jgi:guanyl-specific ribonuclease Sa